MITYNHEKYIAEAIEGILMQAVDFEVELIIADDASPDQTRKIVQSYIDNHPKGYWIKYSRHSENIGMMSNFVWALSQCKGEFIALCEGDDYWLDSSKLVKQVSFLQNNLSCSLVYHPTKLLMPNGNLIDDYIAEKYFRAPESTIVDLAIYGNYIHTPSVVFRKSCLIISENFVLSPVGDYFLYLLLAKEGKIKRLEFLGAVYRNGTGSFSRLDFEERKFHRQKTLSLASSDIDSILVSFILKLRIHHNSFLGKLDNVILEPSGVDSFLRFFMYVKKLELLKSIIKNIFFRRV